MERRLSGADFADVRVHTDARAAASAAAVEAIAYTVGRHIVFGAGAFDPGSPNGRTLLAHELAHAAESAPGTAPETGPLQIGAPGAAAERDAVRRAHGGVSGAGTRTFAPTLRRQSNAVALTGVRVDHDRVTVPPEPALSFTATATPARATGVTFALAGTGGTTIATGTAVGPGGAITVAAGQTGGPAEVSATQTITHPDGSSNTTTATAPFNFVGSPGAISRTTSAVRGARGFYGGSFTHTFSPPTGSTAVALSRAHLNEQFAGARGTTLTLTGPLGTFTITVNDPTSPNAGWDLDSSGTMVAPDSVTWDTSTSARPFVANASNPTPTTPLPAVEPATQTWRNLSFPSRTYSPVTAAVHRRAFEDRTGIKAVTSVVAAPSAPQVVETYVGPPVFRNCRAASGTVTPSAPRGRGAPPAHTLTVTVDRDGAAAPPTTFSIQGAALGCSVNARTGVVTIGSTAGSITVRAGDATNFDETVVTIATPPAPASPRP